MSTSILLLLCICAWVQTGLSSFEPLVALNWTDPVGGSPSQTTFYTKSSSVQGAPASGAIVTPPYLSTTSLQAILPGVTTKPASISAIVAPFPSITPSPVTLGTPYGLQSGVPAGCIPFACKIIFQVGYPHVNMDGMDLISYSTLVYITGLLVFRIQLVCRPRVPLLRSFRLECSSRNHSRCARSKLDTNLFL